MAPFDPTDMVDTALRADPLVRSVTLVGSRVDGTATALSDWDYHVGSSDPAVVASRLPDLVRSLRPLSQLWDPLARRPVFMLLVAAGAAHVVKVDLFLDLPDRRPPADRVTVTAAALPGIDAHFWDWNLWLGGKRLRGGGTGGETGAGIRAELAKMWSYLLEPLGGTVAPTTQREAIAEYLRLRAGLERRHGVHIAPDLGRAVRETLAAHGLS